MSSAIDAADVNVKKGSSQLRCEELCGCPELFSKKASKKDTKNSEFEGWELVEFGLVQPRKGHLFQAASDELGLYSYAIEYSASWQGEKSVGRGLRSGEDIKQLRWALGHEVVGAVVPPLPESVLNQGDGIAAALFAFRLTSVPAFRVSKSLISFCLDMSAFAIIFDKLFCADAAYKNGSFWTPSSLDSRWLTQVRDWHKGQEADLNLLKSEIYRLRSTGREAFSAENTLFEKATSFFKYSINQKTPDNDLSRQQDKHLDSCLADAEDMLGYLVSVTEAAHILDTLTTSTRTAQRIADRNSDQPKKTTPFEHSLNSLKATFLTATDISAQEQALKASELNHRLQLAQARFNDEVRQCQHDFSARRTSLVTKLVKTQADYHAACAERFHDVLDDYLHSSQSSQQNPQDPPSSPHTDSVLISSSDSNHGGLPSSSVPPPPPPPPPPQQLRHDDHQLVEQ